MHSPIWSLIGAFFEKCLRFFYFQDGARLRRLLPELTLGRPEVVEEEDDGDERRWMEAEVKPDAGQLSPDLSVYLSTTLHKIFHFPSPLSHLVGIEVNGAK